MELNLWYIYKNTFHNSTFKQDLDILSYLYLFPPKNNFDISLSMLTLKHTIDLSNTNTVNH